MTRAARTWLAPTAALFAAAFGASRLSDLQEARARLSVLRADASVSVRSADRAAFVPIADAEGAVTRAARDARLTRLTNLSTTGDVLSLDWESDLASSVTFLLRQRGLAARIPRLSVTSSESSPGLVQVHAGIQQGPPSTWTRRASSAREGRLRSLWHGEPSFARLAAENVRRQEADRRQQEERADKERRDRNTSPA